MLCFTDFYFKIYVWSYYNQIINLFLIVLYNTNIIRYFNNFSGNYAIAKGEILNIGLDVNILSWPI